MIINMCITQSILHWVNYHLIFFYEFGTNRNFACGELMHKANHLGPPQQRNTTGNEYFWLMLKVFYMTMFCYAVPSVWFTASGNRGSNLSHHWKSHFKNMYSHCQMLGKSCQCQCHGPSQTTPYKRPICA